MIQKLFCVSRHHQRTDSGKTATGIVYRFFILFLITATAQSDDSLTYLKSLGIEELLTTEVTSVSKKAEKLTDATAAVFVITADDIRRAGARTIAEALRLAPGLHVSRFDTNKWIISSRGFSDTFSNKLLVLMDGRSVYTPLFSGVYWDAQDTLMEDIDRIEVIRGPGATLWGANAVNGVINIITKSAQQTQGALVTAGAGSDEAYEVSTRYGAQLGADGAWRIYAKGFDRDNLEPGYGHDDGGVSWRGLQSGFRMDLDLTYRDAVTVQGDIYEASKSQIFILPNRLTAPSPGSTPLKSEYYGGNLLARFRRSYSDNADVTIQLYYDRTNREFDQVEGASYLLSELRDTVDFDFQHRFVPGDRLEFIWGAGYRYTKDDLSNGYLLSMYPDSRSDQLFSLFAQNEFTLQPDRWWLTLGSKLEHNDYTGYEMQPSARLRWKPRSNQTVWTAVSRAVRTPSRGEQNLRCNMNAWTANSTVPPYTATNYIAAYFGDGHFDAETLTAYELGYRWQHKSPFSLDLAAFYNRYDNLRTIEVDPQAAFVESDPEPEHIVIPAFINNCMEGETFGLELTAVWLPRSYWKLTANYSWMQMLLQTKTDGLFIESDEWENYSPVNQIQLRSCLDLSHGWAFDAELYYVDKITAFDIPAHTRLDLRLGWQPSARWEFSLNGENLLDSDHVESGTRYNILPSRIPSRVYGTITWRY